MNAFFRLAHLLLAPVFRCMFRVEVKGLEILPRSGVMLCPNHSSNWDPLLMLSVLPVDYHLYSMAKDSLFRIPVLSSIIRACGGFPVARGHSDIQAVKTAMQTIKNGDNLLIFPEGTRVDHEGEVEAKGGVAMIAIRTGATIVPVYITPEKKLFHRVRIVFGPVYEPVYTGRRGTAEELQKIADDIVRIAYDLGRETA